MKDVVTEIQASEDLSVKHTEVELQSADGATKAYILYSREPDEFNAAAKSVSYGGAELLSAKVYADEAEAISFAEVTGAKLEEVKIPGGLARDAFIKKWLKAAKKNKQGLLPFLLLPLTACCHSGGSALLTSFSGTLAAANALNTALFTSSFTVTLSDAGSMDAGDLGTLLTKTSGEVFSRKILKRQIPNERQNLSVK
jgi:hypothetical protein